VETFIIIVCLFQRPTDDQIHYRRDPRHQVKCELWVFDKVIEGPDRLERARKGLYSQQGLLRRRHFSNY
jgi:hypothetical protein